MDWRSVSLFPAKIMGIKVAASLFDPFSITVLPIALAGLYPNEKTAALAGSGRFNPVFYWIRGPLKSILHTRPWKFRNTAAHTTAEAQKSKAASRE